MRIPSTAYLDPEISIMDRRNLRRMDPILVALAFTLCFIGLLNMFSATYGASSAFSTQGEGFWAVLKSLRSGDFGNQFIYFIAGLFAASLIVCVDYRFLAGMGPFVYGLAILSLVLVLYYGTTKNDASRWLNLGVTRIQPSEFAKLAVIYFMAWYLGKIGPRIKKLPWFILAYIIAAVPAALIFKQPSLSAALVMFPIVTVMMYIAGCRFWHISALAAAAILLILLVSYQLYEYKGLIEQYKNQEQSNIENKIKNSVDNKDPLNYKDKAKAAYEKKNYLLGLKLRAYHLDRILTFLDPNEDPSDKGYQILQALITVGSGEMLGKGFCEGTQTHLSFLPFYNTDFIFALLAEEWGFMGSVTVLGLFAAFLLRAIVLAQSCPEPTGELLVIGCVTLFAFHAFCNIGITIGVLPVTGMPLPFLSFGGSFYLTAMMSVGTILSVQVRKRFFE